MLLQGAMVLTACHRLVTGSNHTSSALFMSLRKTNVNFWSMLQACLCSVGVCEVLCVDSAAALSCLQVESGFCKSDSEAREACKQLAARLGRPSNVLQKVNAGLPSVDE